MWPGTKTGLHKHLLNIVGIPISHTSTLPIKTGIKRVYKNLSEFLLTFNFPVDKSKNYFKPWLVLLSGLSASLHAKQRVAGSISNLGHVPGLLARSPVGGVQEATTH